MAPAERALPGSVTSMASAASRASFSARCQLFGTFGDGVFNGRAGLIDHLTHLGPLFRAQFAHAPQYGGKLALFAQYAHADVLQLRGNLRLLYIRQHPLANLFQHILQVLSLLVFP